MNMRNAHVRNGLAGCVHGVVGGSHSLFSPPPMSARKPVDASADAAARRSAAAKAAAETRRENKRKQAEEEERAAQAAKRREQAVIDGHPGRKDNVLAARAHAQCEMNRAAYVFEHGMRMYERLVKGGAPPALADKLMHNLASWKHSGRADGLTERFEMQGLNDLLHGEARVVAEGADVKALLEREGFTDVLWTVWEGYYAKDAYSYGVLKEQWRCVLTYTHGARGYVPRDDE